MKKSPFCVFLAFALLGSFPLFSLSCSASKKLPIGANCRSNSDCASQVCVYQICQGQDYDGTGSLPSEDDTSEDDSFSHGDGANALEDGYNKRGDSESEDGSSDASHGGLEDSTSLPDSDSFDVALEEDDDSLPGGGPTDANDALDGSSQGGSIDASDTLDGDSLDDEDSWAQDDSTPHEEVPAPEFTHSIPSSPSNTIQPIIEGTSLSGHRVLLYGNASCSGRLWGQSTVPEGEDSFSTPVVVDSNEVNKIYAVAVAPNGLRSACVGPFYYEHDDIPPNPPQIYSWPLSPSLEAEPTVFVNSDLGDRTFLFRDSDCQYFNYSIEQLEVLAVSTGHVPDINGFPTVISANLDGSTFFSAMVADQAGNLSECSPVFEYVHGDGTCGNYRIPCPSSFHCERNLSENTAHNENGRGSFCISNEFLFDGTPAADFEDPMAFIPHGDMYMGCSPLDNQCRDSEKSQHKVYLLPFAIDLTPVTAGAYAKCVSAGACSYPVVSGHDADAATFARLGKEDHPINFVTWDMAKAYCTWQGKILPTEAMWEYAIRGGCDTLDGLNCAENMRVYPWGNKAPLPCSTANIAISDEDGLPVPCNAGAPNYSKTSPVKSFPSGRSPYGLYDGVGNVHEWVADLYSDEYRIPYWDDSPVENPEGPSSGEEYVIRGGAFDSIAHHVLGASARGGVRNAEPPYTRSSNMGFRCARKLRY